MQQYFLADRTAAHSVIGCCHPSVVRVCLSVCDVVLWLIHHSHSKVSEQVNRNCPLRNTIFQLSTPTSYNYPIRLSVQTPHRKIDKF